MKKIIASAGLVAVGAVTLNAQYAPGLTRMETSKPWSVSASLRGFYDDNFATAPRHVPDAFRTVIPEAEDSFGFEISPAFALNFPLEQTYVRLGYIYSMRYYEDRPSDHIDQSHEANLKLEHRFTERYKLNFDDSFVYSQEPQVIDTEIITSPLIRRRDGDVLRNHASLGFTAAVTERATARLGYDNMWYNYDDQLNSALLDRMDHRFTVEGLWQVQQNLMALFGYNYRMLDYQSSDIIAGTPPGPVFRGEDRSSDSHYLYVGAEKSLSAQLTGAAKVGASYTSFEVGDSKWSPYADMNLTYTYLPGSYVQLGFRHDLNATDVVFGTGAAGGDITRSGEYSSVYGQVTHRITPALSGSLLGQYQHATFEGGGADNDTDDLFLVGANLEYKFNQHWSSELGYNYDALASDIDFRGFIRNRVYIGVRASY